MDSNPAVVSLYRYVRSNHTTLPCVRRLSVIGLPPVRLKMTDSIDVPPTPVLLLAVHYILCALYQKVIESLYRQIKPSRSSEIDQNRSEIRVPGHSDS